MSDPKPADAFVSFFSQSAAVDADADGPDVVFTRQNIGTRFRDADLWEIRDASAILR